MIAAVADTHTAVWYLFNNPKLSAGARETDRRHVPVLIHSESCGRLYFIPKPAMLFGRSRARFATG